MEYRATGAQYLRDDTMTFSIEQHDTLVRSLIDERVERERSDDEQWRAIDRLADAYQSLSLSVQWYARWRWLFLGAALCLLCSNLAVLAWVVQR